MYRLIHLLRTSIGRKLVMALSGLVLLLFLLGHLAGNMTIFFGPPILNSYAHWLQHSVMLWPFRLLMLLLVGLHIVMGLELARENRLAATSGSRYPGWFQRHVRNHHMLWSGVAVLLFLLFHVAHLTLGVGAGAAFHQLDSRGMIDVYQRVVEGFRTPWIAGLYMLSLLLIGLHLLHVVRGLFQTLGFYHERYLPLLERLAQLLTLVLVVGFLSIPLAVWVGLL
jgi:succinate dehydrogenase / fumarate reductase cytochrome b subunit